MSPVVWKNFVFPDEAKSCAAFDHSATVPFCITRIEAKLQFVTGGDPRTPGYSSQIKDLLRHSAPEWRLGLQSVESEGRMPLFGVDVNAGTRCGEKLMHNTINVV